MNTGAQFCTATATSTCIGTHGLAAAAIGSAGSDNTDVNIGGLVNLPSFNTGIAWDQPWGHVMARVGVGRSEIRNATATPILGGTSPANNITQWHWAVEGGVMVNTWGQDQVRGLVNYSHGLSTYNSDAPSGVVDMIINGQTGQISSLNELELTGSYIHRFNPNWRATGSFGIGFINKPDAAAGFGNCANNTAVNLCVAGGANAAQLAGIEKRHIFSAAALTYSPVPGMVDIKGELDYYNRQVQASNTNASALAESVSVSFYW
jgi:hypothetical protein